MVESATLTLDNPFCVDSISGVLTLHCSRVETRIAEVTVTLICGQYENGYDVFDVFEPITQVVETAVIDGVISKGQSIHRLHFILPEDAPPSMDFSTPKSVRLSTEYVVYTGFKWKKRRSQASITRKETVYDEVKPNVIPRHNVDIMWQWVREYVVSNRVVHFTCTDECTVGAKIMKRVWIPGESVVVVCTVSNRSNRKIKNIEVGVLTVVAYPDGDNYSKEKLKIPMKISTPDASGRVCNRNSELRAALWCQFPDEVLVPYSLFFKSYRTCFSVTFFITVKFRVRFGRDVVLRLPIEMITPELWQITTNTSISMANTLLPDKFETRSPSPPTLTHTISPERKANAIYPMPQYTSAAPPPPHILAWNGR